MSIKDILIIAGVIGAVVWIVKQSRKSTESTRSPDEVITTAQTEVPDAAEKQHPAGQDTPGQDNHADTAPQRPVTSGEIAIGGWQTQFAGVSENDRTTQIVIGLDFGTAFTKVVIYAPIANKRYAIPLNETAQSIEQYLLPTCLYQDSAGNLTLAKPENCQTRYTDFKMRILDDNLDEATRKHIVTYLACVLQKSRKWLLTEKQKVLGHNRLDWDVNIGMPTENYDDSGLKEKYRALVSDAWYESTRQPREHSDAAPSNDTAYKLSSERIEVFPEFAAQIQSYIHSSQRHPGVHAIVDIGAGTIDATGFIVHSDQEGDIHPILSKSVQKLGTACLAQHRCTKIETPTDWRPSPQELLPTSDEFAEKLGVTSDKIVKIDKEFKQKMQQQINSVLQEANKESPMNPEWNEDLPLILCGGGMRVKFYDQFYPEELKKRGLAITKHGKALSRTHFPGPDQLDAPDLLAEDPDRLSVAYGLAFDALTMGEIMYPTPFSSEAEQSESGARSCLKCNGTGGGYGNCPKCGGSGFL